MHATLQPSLVRPVRPRRVSVGPRLTLEELLRRAAANVDRGQVKLISGRFRPAKRGRALTPTEKGLMLLLAGGLGLAIWLHARPVPLNAHTTYFQSLAASTRLETGAPRSFAEAALRTIGRDWRATTLFTCANPAFWHYGPEVHPNTRAARIEQGLARLAAHGPVVSVMTFPAPTAVETDTVDGMEVLASRVAGQLELADGTVVRFAARLVQDGSTKRWGLAELKIPGFLP